MLEIRFKNQILATIDQLRKRKARPDINRISKYMWKVFKVVPKDTKSDLKKCLSSRAVYQVQYKGNISFRNAAKWKRAKAVKALESQRSLVKQRATHIARGQTMPKVAKRSAPSLPLSPKTHSHQSRPHSAMSDDAISTNTKLTSSSSESSPMPSNRSARQSAELVRVGARPKRAKKVFDPSDLAEPPRARRRGRPVGSLNKATLKKQAGLSGASNGTDSIHSNEDEQRSHSRGCSESGNSGGVCSVCLQGGKGSRLIECRDCSNKAHPSCLGSSGVLRLRPDSTWQCPHCKTCSVCCETNDAGILTVCSLCADAYHSLCHSPRIPDRFQGCDQWECSNCLSMSAPAGSVSCLPQLAKADSAKSSKCPSPQEAMTSANRESLFLSGYEVDRLKLNPEMKLDDDIDPSIPDIRDWTKDDVFNYFYEIFPDAAHILKKQELDGHAVLVARREDIVRGLGLRLGPALKLYRHVVKLQSRRDNFALCWG